MPVRLSNAPTKKSYIGSTKSRAQRLTNLHQGPLANRFQSRYGSDVERSINRKKPKRKGFLSKIASEGYRG